MTAGKDGGAGPFPGAVAVSYLDVYDSPAPDGLHGGSPHLHTACTEGYVVVGGSGRVQTLSADGFAETPLEPMTVAWFSPGVIHRLVNDGDLRIVVVMQNAGLPEAGDAVLTFPPDVLADPDAYRRAAALADPDHAYAAGDEAARRRRDLAVEGFLRLRDGGPAALGAFYAAAGSLVADRVPGWREVWAAGPRAAADRTGKHLDALSTADATHLTEGRLTVRHPPTDRRHGMCGHLTVWPPAG